MVDYAQLALSLRDNEAFQRACDELRKGALEALASVKRDDEASFYRLQATVAVVDEIRGNLEQFIRSGTPKPNPGIA